MILDTNIVIQHIRKREPINPRSLLPIVVVGELKAFALKANWGNSKIELLQNILNQLPVIDIQSEIIDIYAQVDAFSQNKLEGYSLFEGSSRNMGKNDIWIAAMCIYFDIELWTRDNDFDHLVNFGLKLFKEEV